MKQRFSKFLLVLLIFVLVFQECCSFQYGFLSGDEYYKMPPLYKGDDYEECNSRHQASPFCIVKTHLKPDDTSHLYNYIKNFSRLDKIHFRHDKLQRGICLKKCEDAMKLLGNDTENLYVDDFPRNSKVTHETIKFQQIDVYRHLYNKLVNQCVNRELMSLYNLSGYSSIEYCVVEDSSIPIDGLDIGFLVLTGILLMIVLSSTLYDRHLKNCNSRRSGDHYKKELNGKYQNLLTIFSSKRNWLEMNTDTKEEYRELRFLGASRVLVLLAVILAHCFWYLTVIPSNNPAHIENIYSKGNTMLLVNGFYIVQLFFGTSGFLNAFLTLVYIDKSKTKANYFLIIKYILVRIFRFAPVLIYVIYFHSTWLYRSNSGPFWNEVSETERQGCRDNWWVNLLLFNNMYVKGTEVCLVHSWYLAADFQLGILGVIVIVAALRFPKFKYHILGAIFFASFVICGYITYINDLEPIVIVPPETFKNRFAVLTENEKNYFAIYIMPFYMNLGTYFSGVLCAFYYFDFRKKEKKHKQSHFYRFLFFIVAPASLFLINCSYIFYENDYNRSSIWLILLSTLFKHHTAVLFAVLHMGLIWRYGGFILSFYNYPVFRVLGRASYAIYVCHMIMMRLMIAGTHYPIDFNTTNLFVSTISVSVASIGLGILLTIWIDMPFSKLLKAIFMKEPVTVNDDLKLENGHAIDENANTFL